MRQTDARVNSDIKSTISFCGDTEAEERTHSEGQNAMRVAGNTTRPQVALFLLQLLQLLWHLNRCVHDLASGV